MKQYITILVFIMSFGNIKAQVIISRSITDTPRHIIMTDVVINAKKSEAGNYKKRAGSFNSYIGISPAKKDKPNHPFFFSTHCAPLRDVPVKLYNIELKLAPYDDKLFDIKLLVAQVRAAGDTFFRTIDIDAAQLSKKKMLVDVKQADIVLEPSSYYLGYAFIPKALTETYSYRAYYNEGGEGAIITLTGDNIQIAASQDFFYNFPFKVSYITL